MHKTPYVVTMYEMRKSLYLNFPSTTIQEYIFSLTVNNQGKLNVLTDAARRYLHHIENLYSYIGIEKIGDIRLEMDLIFREDYTRTLSFIIGCIHTEKLSVLRRYLKTTNPNKVFAVDAIDDNPLAHFVGDVACISMYHYQEYLAKGVHAIKGKIEPGIDAYMFDYANYFEGYGTVTVKEAIEFLEQAQTKQSNE